MHRILKPILLLAATVVAVEVSQPDATVTDPNTDEGPPSYIRGGSEGSIQYAPATAGQDPAAVDADSSGWGLGKSKGKRRTVTSTGEIIEESDDDEEIDFVITVIFVLMLLMLGAAYMYFSRRNAIAREPDAVKKSWAELTETERVAAKALGHHQRAWNSKLTQRAGALQNAAGRLEALGGSRGAAMEDVDVEVTLMTEAGRSALTLGATEDIHGAVLQELQMPDKTNLIITFGGQSVVAGECCAELGLEDGATLSVQVSDETPPFQRGWSELALEERTAAEALGYNAISWTDSKDWEDLSEVEKRGATSLGHTQKSWDANQKSSVENKDWVQLTHTEREGAEALGYDWRLWDST